MSQEVAVKPQVAGRGDGERPTVDTGPTRVRGSPGLLHHGWVCSRRQLRGKHPSHTHAPPSGSSAVPEPPICVCCSVLCLEPKPVCSQQGPGLSSHPRPLANPPEKLLCERREESANSPPSQGPANKAKPWIQCEAPGARPACADQK